jgi:hypothetical protein
VGWKNIKLLGFAPDLPNTTEGITISSAYVMPTDKGFGNTMVLYEDSTALNSQSLGGALVCKTGGPQRLFVGTATKLYETSFPTPSTLTDRSDTAYSASTTDTWSFAQFGDVTLAVNKQNILRQINAGAAFAAVGVAPVPKAAIVTVCGPVTAPFVMVFDYNDGTNDYRDGWFASGLGDYTNWTTGTNSCVNGRLLDDIPGPILAAIGFRDGVLAWKASGMYFGTYGDTTLIWTWQRISSDIGCIGKNAVTRANDVVYWASDTGIWQFDGSYPRLVPGAVHSYWASKTYTNLNSTTAANNNFYRVLWDRPKHVLHVMGGTATGPRIPFGMSWNSVSGLWVQHYGNTPIFETIADGGATYATEIISARYVVTINSKVGRLSWDVTATEPPDGFMHFWVISDYVTTTICKGARPHVSVHSASSTSQTTPAVNFGGVIYSYATEADITASMLNTLDSAALTWRSPDRLDGQLAAPIINLRLTTPIHTAWEITGLTIDLTAAGRS